MFNNLLLLSNLLGKLVFLIKKQFWEVRWEHQPCPCTLAPWPSWLCSREGKISTHHSTLASQCHMEDGLQSASGSAHTLSW